MNTTSMIIIGAVTVLVVAAYVGLFIYRKQQREKFFNQVFDMAKQVPKQKKNSFLLLLFKESIPKPKNKGKSSTNLERLNNPKHLEVLLIQMTSVLKDSSKVTDKTMLKALKVFKDYQAWEKAKTPKDKQSVQTKAS